MLRAETKQTEAPVTTQTLGPKTTALLQLKLGNNPPKKLPHLDENIDKFLSEQLPKTPFNTLDHKQQDEFIQELADNLHTLSEGDIFLEHYKDQLECFLATALRIVSPKSYKSPILNELQKLSDIQPFGTPSLVNIIFDYCGLYVFYTGILGKTHTFVLKESDTIIWIKHLAHLKGEPTPGAQSLLYKGRSLNNAQTISDCKIENETTVREFVRSHKIAGFN